MKRKELIMNGLLILGWFIVSAASATPIPTLCPPEPEGNRTFIDGVTWCVARPGVFQEDLQNALDWAVRPGRRRLHSDSAGSREAGAHVSYAFNIFYQQNGNSDVACNFGGAGTIIKRDPSLGSCKFLASE